jgi:hypothetical protein
MRRFHSILVASFALLLFASVLAEQTSERMRMLYIGDYTASNPGVVAIESDPKLLPSYVPATTGWFAAEEIQRAMRLYLPRTYDSYVGGSDITVLSDADPWSLPDAWNVYIRRSVAEDGLSVLMTGGHRGLGGTGAARQHWDGTPVEEVLPVTIVGSSIIGNIGLGATLKPIIARPDDPLMMSLPWEACPWLTEVNEVLEKQGAITPFVLEEAGNPVISYWDYSEGRSLIFGGDWHGYSTRAMQYWQFFDDAVINMVYHAGKLDLPPDPIIANQLRSSFKKFRLMEAGLNSVLEFVEKFGANTFPVRKDMEGVRDIRRDGERLYLEQDYLAALARMGEAIQEMQELEKKAVGLQEAALLWVYTIEWLVVTATCMVTGFAVYEIMVRRRFYREMKTTKSARGETR